MLTLQGWWERGVYESGWEGELCSVVVQHVCAGGRRRLPPKDLSLSGYSARVSSLHTPPADKRRREHTSRVAARPLRGSCNRSGHRERERCREGVSCRSTAQCGDGVQYSTVELPHVTRCAGLGRRRCCGAPCTPAAVTVELGAGVESIHITRARELTSPTPP